MSISVREPGSSRCVRCAAYSRRASATNRRSECHWRCAFFIAFRRYASSSDDSSAEGPPRAHPPVAPHPTRHRSLSRGRRYCAGRGSLIVRCLLPSLSKS